MRFKKLQKTGKRKQHREADDDHRGCDDGGLRGRKFLPYKGCKNEKLLLNSVVAVLGVGRTMCVGRRRRRRRISSSSHVSALGIAQEKVLYICYMLILEHLRLLCSRCDCFDCSMSVARKCSNTDVTAKHLVTGVFTQHLRSAVLNVSKEITHDTVASIFAGLSRACSLPLPSTLLDSQPLEKGGLDVEGV